jgi:hypothetical protein
MQLISIVGVRPSLLKMGSDLLIETDLRAHICHQLDPADESCVERRETEQQAYPPTKTGRSNHAPREGCEGERKMDCKQSD